MNRPVLAVAALASLVIALGSTETTSAEEAGSKHAMLHAKARKKAVDDRKSPKKSTVPLPGKTIDFTYDAKDIKSPSRAYMGRIFVHEKAAAKGKPLPLVVFMHGLNRDLVKYRWMGGGEEGDVRRIVSDLIDAEKIPPVILAGPSSIQPDAVSGSASFPTFDFDRFMALTRENLAGVAEIDESRIIVTGHSGAGCSAKGGIVSAVHASQVPFAVVSIDTCMGADLAKELAGASSSTHVVVTYETVSWDRDFAGFEKTFKTRWRKNQRPKG